MVRRLASLLGAALVLAAGGGCWLGHDDDHGGLSQIAADRFFPPIGPTSTIRGVVVHADNGCVLFDAASIGNLMWVVWPEGAMSVPDGVIDYAVRLRGGKLVRRGDHVEIEGQLMTRLGLPQGEYEGSYWGAYSRYCLPNEEIIDPEVIRAKSVTVIATS